MTTAMNIIEYSTYICFNHTLISMYRLGTSERASAVLGVSFYAIFKL